MSKNKIYENYRCDGRETWLQIFRDLSEQGKLVSPRGQKCLEVEDYTVIFHPIRDKFCSFEERNLSLKYLAGEFAWYLNGDRDNRGIEAYSKFWAGIRNLQSPFYNSNYGYYFFIEGQLNYLIGTLVDDQDSRQACVMINRKEVAMSQSTDKLCTNAVMFRIRDNELNMTVQMRSNDVVFGLGIDCVMFSWVYEIVYQKLKEHYPELKVGRYFHTSGSFHVYERHFPMVEKILYNDGENYQVHDFPVISSPLEVDLLTNRYSTIEEGIRNQSDLEPKVDTGYGFTRRLISGLKGGGFQGDN